MVYGISWCCMFQIWIYNYIHMAIHASWCGCPSLLIWIPMDTFPGIPSFRVTHICVRNMNVIGSNNGLSPRRHQAIIWTNDGILLIPPPFINQLQWNLHGNSHSLIQEVLIVWKIVAILSRSCRETCRLMYVYWTDRWLVSKSGIKWILDNYRHVSLRNYMYQLVTQEQTSMNLN